MAFELPALPYAYNALEPYIDEETMHLHHDKHHQAYINNLNAALQSHADFAALSAEDLVRDLNEVPEGIRTAVRNNGGGHYNHTMFWQNHDAQWRRQPDRPHGRCHQLDFRRLRRLQEQPSTMPVPNASAPAGRGWLPTPVASSRSCRPPTRTAHSRTTSTPSWATTCGNMPTTSSTRTAAPTTSPPGGTSSTGTRSTNATSRLSASSQPIARACIQERTVPRTVSC